MPYPSPPHTDLKVWYYVLAIGLGLPYTMKQSYFLKETNIVAQIQRDDIVDVVTVQFMTHMCLYVSVCDTLDHKCNCAITQSCTICVCIGLGDGGVRTSSPCLEPLQLIIHAAQFCHVECSDCPEREAHMNATEDCPADWFVFAHTHTHHHLIYYTTDTQRNVYVHGQRTRLRVCHSSLERLLGLVLLPVLIVAQAE